MQLKFYFRVIFFVLFACNIHLQCTFVFSWRKWRNFMKS